MKKIIALLLTVLVCLTFAACSFRPSFVEKPTLSSNTDNNEKPGDQGSNGGGDSNKFSRLPSSFFIDEEANYVSGSIIQTGSSSDSNEVVPVSSYLASDKKSNVSSLADLSLDKKSTISLLASENDSVIKGYEYELEGCYVSGYIGKELFIIQDFGSLAWNKKGIGHRDGSYLWSFDAQEGFFSISSMNENMIIVGNPTDSSVESLWDDNSSYLFGYLVYDEESKTLVPLYEDDNLRFYTATYFINGYAIVSVEVDGEILFGVINTEGEYVIEPGYAMIHDEAVNGIAISSKNITMLESEFPTNSLVGRNIIYSNTLFTNVQHIRCFEYTTSTSGLVDVSNGEEILPCIYSYVEYIGNNEYFVIDSEGSGYIFNALDRTIESSTVKCAYFSDGWVLVKNEDGTIALRDSEGNMYSTEELYLGAEPFLRENSLDTYFSAEEALTMTNILTAQREEKALTYRSEPKESFFDTVEGNDTGYKIWNKAHDQYIEADLVSCGYGRILFVKDNYVYRLDYDTFEYTRLEIGYGGFDKLNVFNKEGGGNAEFKTYINLMGDGIYNVRIEQRMGEGSWWFDVIINEYGDIILDIAVNATNRFDTNYLGVYDSALYEMAGNTDMKDNYFIIRNDGHACLLQFVRKNVFEKEPSGSGNDIIEYPERNLSNDGSSVVVSPFIFNFKDPSNIEVTFEGNVVDSQHYYYDASAQSLKFDPYYLDPIMCDEEIREKGSFSFLVKAGDEEATVTFWVEFYKPYN